MVLAVSSIIAWTRGSDRSATVLVCVSSVKLMRSSSIISLQVSMAVGMNCSYVVVVMVVSIRDVIAYYILNRSKNQRVVFWAYSLTFCEVLSIINISTAGGRDEI